MPSSSSSSKKQYKKETDHEKRIRLKALGRKNFKTCATEIFNELSQDGTWLSASQVDNLLGFAMNLKPEEEDEEHLDPNAVQFVVETTLRRQKKAGCCQPQQTSPPPKPIISEEDGQDHDEGTAELFLHYKYLIGSLGKYEEYLKKSNEIEHIFRKYHNNKKNRKNNNDALTKEELILVLQDYERKQCRSKNGVVKYMMVTDKDVECILQDVVLLQTTTISGGDDDLLEDHDEENTNLETDHHKTKPATPPKIRGINRGQYLLAIQSWEELVQKKLDSPEECILL